MENDKFFNKTKENEDILENVKDELFALNLVKFNNFSFV